MLQLTFSSHLFIILHSFIFDLFAASDEDQEKIESLLGHHTKTSGKKQQDRIPVLKATSSKSPILRASSCDSMPLLARIEDEISPACTAHDCIRYSKFFCLVFY